MTISISDYVYVSLSMNVCVYKNPTEKKSSVYFKAFDM